MSVPPEETPANDTSGMPLPSLQDPCYVNAMIHFYRGELGRIMVWRQRLDVTTTWAITSSTAIITVAFTYPQVPHIVFFFNLALVWIMLWIESRRYRFYDAFRGRVRMLEAHFLVPMISQSQNLLGGEWRRLVCEDLIMPSFKIGKLEAVGRLAFENLNGLGRDPAELAALAGSLLADDEAYAAEIEKSRAAALEKLSFSAVAAELQKFLN